MTMAPLAGIRVVEVAFGTSVVGAARRHASHLGTEVPQQRSRARSSGTVDEALARRPTRRPVDPSAKPTYRRVSPRGSTVPVVRGPHAPIPQLHSGVRGEVHDRRLGRRVSGRSGTAD